MKRIIFIAAIGAVVASWGKVHTLLGIHEGPKMYSIGNYSNDKWYQGAHGYEEAIRISQEQKSPMIIYVYADWCRYCKEFQSTLLVDGDVKSTLNNYIKVTLNPDKNEADKALYKRWGGGGYPTLLMQSGAGKPLRLNAPYYRDGNGWKMLSSPQFISLLKRYSS